MLYFITDLSEMLQNAQEMTLPKQSTFIDMFKHFVRVYKLLVLTKSMQMTLIDFERKLKAAQAVYKRAELCKIAIYGLEIAINTAKVEYIQ